MVESPESGRPPPEVWLSSPVLAGPLVGCWGVPRRCSLSDWTVGGVRTRRETRGPSHSRARCPGWWHLQHLIGDRGDRGRATTRGQSHSRSRATKWHQSSQDQVSFTCPVCLDLFKDPVTIPCGHNFCMQCIKEDWKGEYICPLCRHTFSSRTVLHKNRLMAEMVEKFVKTSIQTPASDRCYAGPGDVACDVCTSRKLKAVKSCLDCLMSYCDTHLKAHYELVGRNHTMTEAPVQLKERICPRHQKAFEIFCRTDQSCICVLCTMDDHKGHDTTMAAAEWSHKKEGLGQSQKRCQQMIQLKEKELQKLKKAVETLKSGAQTAVKKSEKMFTEMIHCIERRRSENMQDMVPISGDARSDTVARRTLNQSRFFVPLKKSLSALQMQLEEKLDSIFK
ncbi:E3 ubiquitin/ISG15 ligase TRIM25-like [Engraulis encrasicolus]|uniref:E3 ubiquitin/ISG15 ligase TRIM25-like n=1 Tax=Engraulis encrasicolus TaxID=184585 RepID=UPI002FD783F2